MIQKFTLFSFVALACQFSFAAVISSSVGVVDGTASRMTSVANSTSGTGTTGTTTTTTYTYTIFGGYTGDIGDCAVGTRTSSSVCNSCTAMGDVCTTQPYACAERSIHPDLSLGITMAMDQIPNNAVVRVEYGSTTNVLTPSAVSTTTFAANSAFTVYVRWSDLCRGSAGTGDATCKGAGQTTDLTVGLVDNTSSSTFASGNSQKFTVKIRYQDPTDAAMLVTPTQDPTTTQGFTDFQVLPGDEKVYVREPWRGLSPGDSSGINWSALRLYFEEAPAAPAAVDFCAIPLNANTAQFADFALTTASNTSGDSSLSPDFMEGLSNDVNYMFTAATVDEATIVSNFLRADGNDPEQVARYTAMPGEVVGLLDNKKCFIATAAFGSPMEPHVELLRNFRDQVLGHFWLGKKFIRFYYDNSPPLAQFISEHDSLRALVRGILWPIILFADLSLQWGTGIAFLIYVLGAAVLIFAVKKGRAWRKA